MKKTTTYQSHTVDDTIVCSFLPMQIQDMMAQAACLELCESIVADVEFRNLCREINNAVDMTEHAILESPCRTVPRTKSSKHSSPRVTKSSRMLHASFSAHAGS